MAGCACTDGDVEGRRFFARLLVTGFCNGGGEGEGGEGVEGRVERALRGFMWFDSYRGGVVTRRFWEEVRWLAKGGGDEMEMGMENVDMIISPEKKKKKKKKKGVDRMLVVDRRSKK